jgi:hypothetical protein
VGMGCGKSLKASGAVKSREEGIERHRRRCGTTEAEGGRLRGVLGSLYGDCSG